MGASWAPPGGLLGRKARIVGSCSPSGGLHGSRGAPDTRTDHDPRAPMSSKIEPRGPRIPAQRLSPDWRPP
eukprot:1194121-Pyramimonas_sp.AAC.1